MDGKRSQAQLVTTQVHPQYDRAASTRRQCIVGCAVSWVVGLICVGSGAYIASTDSSDPVITVTGVPRGAQLGATLAIDVFVTLCTDCLGFAHATSLRWHLWQEGRLSYNSNLRLLTGSRTSVTNGCFMNLVLATALVFSYAASSQILVSPQHFRLDGSTYTYETLGNAVALIVLGISILVQSAAATVCLAPSHQTRILSWSSNPLNTALACLHHGLEHRSGRSMLSADRASQSASASRPQARQPSAYKVGVSVRRIVWLAWVMFILAALWASIILGVDYQVYGGRHGSLKPSLYNESVGFGVANRNWGGQRCLAILIVAAIQSFVTLGTHLVELLINRARDEQQWRRAANTAKGAHIYHNSVIAAATSWQNIFLFTLKPVIHWLFGLGLALSGDKGTSIAMAYLPLYLLTAVACILAVFATYLALHRPGGSQPAAWGNLQTLADLIDEWGPEGTKVLYWGDKGPDPSRTGIRHAGTSSRKEGVAEILDRSLYN